jgi:hypothetical protein
MNTEHRAASETELSYFISIQQELRECLRTDRLATARLALEEMEGLWMHTEWPRLRRACADFMRTHARHCDFAEFRP